MSLAPRLEIRQSQSLVMTPQLQQAIKLLALSNLEIEGVIAEELDKNPLLDTGTGDGELSPGAPEVDRRDSFDAADEPLTADRLIAAGNGVADAPLDADYAGETFIHDGPTDALPDAPRGLDGGLGMDGIANAAPEGGGDLDLFAANEPSLHDHLLGQAGEVLAGSDLLIATHLIDQIDEAGYLTADLLELSQRLGAPLVRVKATLTAIQSFDPTGVGARTLAECIALQAKEADRYDPCMAKLIDNLDLVARGEIARLKRLCQVDDEDIADMIRELRSYDPKPGLRFGGERPSAAVPDIFVAKTRTGWAVELNSLTLPRVLVNRSYYAELSSGAHNKAEKVWLTDCLQSANWLAKALDQRARTIVKVAAEIVKQQEAFFDHGVEQLRPLTLRMVADAIEMHESTVSRVTSNKYLSCARGLYELKYFFTSAIQASDGGEAVSAQAVKSHIVRLISAEAPGDILSDDKLVELLREKGFDIARRTVAKYREAVGLGSSVQRRRRKALGRAA